jgi:hypothetical protein
MTEAVFFAELLALLYCMVLFRDVTSRWVVAGAGLATWAATLTRYEGWFLIPFVTAYFLVTAPERRLGTAVLYGAIASIGPLLWLAHNLWWFGDALDFYRGPYSPKAIQGAVAYPGEHDWRKALEYFFAAARQTTGWLAIALGFGGFVVALFRRALWPLLLLALPPLFYVVSMVYSGGTPISVPNLFPFSYYNTRYGLSVLPLLAFATGALLLLAPKNVRSLTASILLVAAAAWWAARPSPEAWLCWKESQVNSVARREWTREAADYLKAHYRGGGIFTSSGDIAGIYREAGIPLRATLYDGNQPEWMACVARPDTFLHESWAVAQEGDAVSSAIAKTSIHGRRYTLVHTIQVKTAPALQIYRRGKHANPVH